MKKPLRQIINESLNKVIRGPRAKKLAKHHLGQWKADIEPNVHDQQYEYIKKNYSKKEAERANYGWGTDADERSVSVATKVYGKRPGVVTSYVKYPNKKAEHDDG